MNVNTANRACALLYSFIKEHNNGTWLLPVNVCPDVPLTFYAAGVPFEFVDIDRLSLCIQEKQCLDLLRKDDVHYAGIVFVRTYGYVYDTGLFFARCKSLNPYFQIIDDRCLCIPEETPNFYGADMVLYSTGHCKQIDLGGGGLAFYRVPTNYNRDMSHLYTGEDEEVLYKEAFSKRKQLNPIPKGWLNLGGYEGYDDYMAKINSQIPNRIEIRESINQIYRKNLPSQIQMPDAFNNWRFHIKVEPVLKNRILEELFKNGLFASSHYQSANRLFDKKVYANSNMLYDSVINLFNDKNYTEEMAKKTCEIILENLNSGGAIVYIEYKSIIIVLPNTMAA